MTKWNGFLWNLHDTDFLKAALQTSEREPPSGQTKGDIGKKKNSLIWCSGVQKKNLKGVRSQQGSLSSGQHCGLWIIL